MFISVQEAIKAFIADGGDSSGFDRLAFCNILQKPSNTIYVVVIPIFDVRVSDTSMTNDVVHDYHTSWSDKTFRLLEVVDIVGFVRINECDVKKLGWRT